MITTEYLTFHLLVLLNLTFITSIIVITKYFGSNYYLKLLFLIAVIEPLVMKWS